MENHRFISKSDSTKARSNRKHIRQQKVHLNVQDSVHASVNPVSSHTEDDYNQPKTPPHSVHATVNRASHDAEDHCALSKLTFLYLYIQLISINYVDTISIYSLLLKGKKFIDLMQDYSNACHFNIRIESLSLFAISIMLFLF